MSPSNSDSEYADDPPAAPEATSEVSRRVAKPVALTTSLVLAAAIIPTLAAVIAVAALAAHDHDGGGGAGAEVAGAEPGAGTTEVNFIATEFAFDPAEVTVAPTVSIGLDNQGDIEHNWDLLAAGTVISTEDEYSDDLSIGIITAASGEVAGDDFTLEPGTYQFICSIPGHFSAGMAGQIVVA